MSTLPRVALCIGHSRMINGHRDGGAVSVGGVQTARALIVLSQK